MPMDKPVWDLLKGALRYKRHLSAGIISHILTALLTVISIPLVIPFFQIIFGESPSRYRQPVASWDIEGWLTYGFSRLVAMSDTYIALAVVCVIVLIVFLLKNVARYAISFFMTYVRNGIMRDLRLDLWQSIQSLPVRERQRHQQGQLMSLMTNDLMEVDHSVVKIYELIFKTPLIILGSLLFMLMIDVRLTLIAGGLILFTLIIVGGVSQVLKRQSVYVQEELSTLTSLADQYLSSLKLVRTFNADRYFDKNYQAHTEKHFSLTNRMLRRRDLASPLAEFLGVATIVALLYFGTYAVLDERLHPSTFFAFIFAFYNIIDPAKSFAREYANLRRGAAALDRVNQFIHGVPPTQQSDHLRKSLSLHQALHLSDVSYNYPDTGTRIFDGIHLSIKKHERIGLIGLSGVGKTTLFDLLLGHLQPSGGVISLDSHPIDDLDPESYRGLYGWVGQRTTLFFGTVRDNILLGQEEDTARLQEVLRKCSLEQGMLDRQVGDQTAGISGGESQRVCLARALYRSPEILLLDEPLSQLDDHHKQEVAAVIKDSALGCTVMMITHDTTLLKDMDRILLVENGSMHDVGQYQELLEHNERILQMLNISQP